MLSLATSSIKIKKSSSSSKKQPLNNKSPCEEPSSSNVQKSSNFSRIFTQEDELKILEAVVEIQQDNPIPSKAAAVIFNDIKDKISAQVNTTQLGEKMRKLRDKYCKENDAELNPHQQQLSILCKKIWRFKKSQVKQKMFKDDDIGNVKEEDFVKNYPFLMKEVSMASNNFVSIDTLRYLDGSMLQQLNKGWKKQHLMELQHLLERLDLTIEYVKLVLDSFASSSKGKDVVDDEEAMPVDDADDELVGDCDDENEESEDVDEEEAEVEVKAVDDDDENEESEDVDDEEEAEAEVEVKVDSDDE